MNLPRHSGQDEESHTDVPPNRVKRTIVAVSILAILVAMVLLHVTGVIHGH